MHVIFIWTDVPYAMSSTSWSYYKRSTKLSVVICGFFSNSFDFHLQFLNWMWVGAVYTTLEAEIQVRRTWGPVPLTPEALWKSVRQDTATKHPAGKTLCPRAGPPERPEWQQYAAAWRCGAVRHVKQCALFTRLQTPDSLVPSGTTFYFSH
jgi:hypothetical protein